MINFSNISFQARVQKSQKADEVIKSMDIPNQTVIEEFIKQVERNNDNCLVSLRAPEPGGSFALYIDVEPDTNKVEINESKYSLQRIPIMGDSRPLNKDRLLEFFFESVKEVGKCIIGPKNKDKQS